jgi:hypothetical protein
MLKMLYDTCLSRPMQFLYDSVCENTHTHTHMYAIYGIFFVFDIFPSVKTFGSRLEQTPGNVSEQRRI